MNAFYIICSLITLAVFANLNLQEWRNGKDVTITYGDIAILVVAMICGYYGLVIALVTIAVTKYEFFRKVWKTYKQKPDETLEGNDQKGE